MRLPGLVAVGVVVLAVAALTLHACSDEGERPAAPEDTAPAAAATTPPADADRGRRRATRDDRRTTGDAATPPPPAPAGLTTGIVRLRSGAPVPGAWVALGEIDASDATTTTDSHGRFGFDELPNYNDLTAFAVIDGVQHYGRAPVSGDLRRLGVTVSPLPPTDPIRIVRIVGHDGGSVAKARIQCVRGAPNDRSTWRPPHATAAGGAFLVRAGEYVGDGQPLVFVVSRAADAEGRPLPYGPALVEIDPWTDAPKTVRLPEGGTVLGRVEGPGGGPLRHARVLCTPSAPPRFRSDDMTALLPIHVLTDADGAFRVDQLAPGTLTLTVEADEERSGASATARVGDPQCVTLRCADLVPARVRVLGDDGQPVGGASVSVNGREKQETDDEGVAELPAVRPDGEPVVVDGEPEHECVTVTVVPGGEIQEIRLRRAGTIRGSVVGPDGAPVEGADVRVGGSTARLAHWTGGGRFAVFGIPVSAPVTLGIRGPGAAWYDTTLAPGEGRHDVVLRIPEPAGTLAVHVADSPHPGAIVMRRAGIEIGRIDDAGQLAHLPGVPGAAPIDVQVGPDASGRYALLRDIAPRGFLRVRLTKGTTVEGRIATAEGHPVPYAKIHATTEQGYATTAKAFGDGRFRIPGLPTGRVKFSTEWRGRRGSAVADAPGEGVAIVID